MNGSTRSLAPAILGWLYLIVLWLTWTPLRDVPARLLWLPDAIGWRDGLGNLLLFAPIGAVLAAYLQSREQTIRRDASRIVVLAAVTGALLSGIVELGQFRVQGRTVSPYDVAMNAAGAAAAAWLVVRLIRAGLSAGVVTAGTAAAVFVGVLVFVTATAFASSRNTRLLLWYDGYPIVAGDELDGQRAYRGVVSDPLICGGPAEDEVCLTPGAELWARTALAGAALYAQRTRLSATVTSHAPQTTQARIVTFSRDGLHRNATLHQEGRDLLLRLRTRGAGPNGSQVEFVLPDAIAEDRATRVSARYERGRVVMRAEDGERSLVGRFPLGYFSGWWLVRDQPRTVIEPRPLLLASAVAALAFAFPLGLLLASWGRLPASGRLIGGVFLPIIVPLPLAGGMKIPVTVEDLVMSALFGLAGAAAGFSHVAASAEPEASRIEA